MNREIKCEEFLGKTFKSIEGLSKDSDEVVFIDSDNRKYEMYHERDCCETVSILEIDGDACDLIDTPITLAEEIAQKGASILDKDGYDWGQTCTWTFYKLGTIKGIVTIRWYGESNGYYSESVSIREI